VIAARHDPSARRATSLSFAHGKILLGALFVVSETRVASKMSVAFGTGDSNFGERARRAGHAIATSLVIGVRDVTCTRLSAPFTHVVSGHGTGKVSDHVIMSFNIIVKYIKS